MTFDGATYSAAADAGRLTTLLYAVKQLMADGQWRTLGEIQVAIGRGSEAGISARLRDFRKPRFGAHVVERRRRGNPADGVFEYRLVLRDSVATQASLLTVRVCPTCKVTTHYQDGACTGCGGAW